MSKKYVTATLGKRTGEGRYRSGAFDQVARRLNRAIKKIENKSQEGLNEAARVIMWGTEQTPPLNPEDTGNLIDSRFVVGGDGEVLMGKSPLFMPKPGRDPAQMMARHNTILSTNRATAQAMQRPVTILGYTAHYAIIVHEDTDMGNRNKTDAKGGTVGFTREGSGNFFFRNSIQRNRKEIIEKVKGKAEEAIEETGKGGTAQ